MSWFKHANKDIKLSNPIINEDFINTYKRTFIAKIRELSKNLKIDNPIIIVAKDCHRKDIWRMNHLSSYKGTRPTYENFMGGPFFKMAYKNDTDDGLFKAAGVKAVLYHPKLEADDCVAIMSKMLLNNNPDCNITIITSDTDYIQLIQPGIKLYNLKYKPVNTDKNSFGNSEKDLFYKIIAGDKCDNILPIFKRCGKKKIVKCYENKDYFEELLIKEYGRVELGYEMVNKNRMLIDFREIPVDLKTQFLNDLPILQSLKKVF